MRGNHIVAGVGSHQETRQDQASQNSKIQDFLRGRNGFVAFGGRNTGKMDEVVLGPTSQMLTKPHEGASGSKQFIAADGPHSPFVDRTSPAAATMLLPRSAASPAGEVPE